MPYLIDGNNVLGLRREDRARDPGARSRLVRQLLGFCREKSVRAIVVFDGEPGDGVPAPRTALGDVTVLYAGKGSDADSRILGILDRAQDSAGFVLVTSDKALGDRARQRRARIITSPRFRRTLDEAGGAGADAPLSPEQVADWEAWFDRDRSD